MVPSELPCNLVLFCFFGAEAAVTYGNLPRIIPAHFVLSLRATPQKTPLDKRPRDEPELVEYLFEWKAA